jgi:predicted amidophosphoribosyltransferase
MALTKCRECAREVAELAQRCPHCGIDKPGMPKIAALEQLGKTLTLVFTVPFVILVVFAVCFR